MLDPRLSPTACRVALAAALVLAACSDDAKNSDDAGGGDDVDQGGVRQPPATDDWGTLGGDVFSTFHNRREEVLTVDNVSDLEVDWIQRTIGGPSGTATINGDMIYITSTGKTFAVKLPGGEVVWEGEGSQASAAYYDGVVYVHTGPADLIAYDAESGEELWRKTTTDHKDAGGYSSPVVSGDLVVVGSSSAEEVVSREPQLTFRGSVVAYDRTTGEEAWRYWTVDEDHTGAAVWSTVSIDPVLGMVYASTGNNYSGEPTDTSDAVIALDLLTGEEQWKNQVTPNDVFPRANGDRGPDYDFGANPILFDMELEGEVRRLLGIGQKSGTFYVMDRTDGSNVWEVNLGPGSAGTGGILNNGAFDGERFIVASNLGTSDGPGSEASRGNTARLAALDPATGDILWERQLGHTVWAPITVANGVGFVAVNEFLQAFNAETGDKLWELETPGSIASGVVVKDGHAYFGSGFIYTSPAIKSNSEFYALKLP